MKVCKRCECLVPTQRHTYCLGCQENRKQEKLRDNRLRSRKWQEENREYNKKKCREWYLAHRKYADAKHKTYLEVPKNRERRREWLSTWRSQVREIHLRKEKIWRLVHQQEYRLKSRIKQQKRRSRYQGSFDKSQWIALTQITGNKCLCCGSYTRIEMDHIIPISRNGGNTILNIQPLCKTCNLKKRIQIQDYRTPKMIQMIQERFSDEGRVQK